MRPSTLNRFMAVVADHLLLSLLWLAGCLPLVTVPASTAALFEVHRRRHRGDDPPAVRAYLAAFRHHLGPTLALGLGWAALGGLLLVDAVIVARMNGSGQMLLTGLIVLFILYAAISVALFPVIVSYDVRAREHLRTAALVAVLSPIRGLLGLAAVTAAVAVVWIVPLAVLAVPSLVATALLRLYRGAFSRLRPAHQLAMSTECAPTNN